jgi:hypothetical protein
MSGQAPAQRLDRSLAMRPMFKQRVLAITEDIMFRWRLLVEGGRKAGHTFSQPDLIIAATALRKAGVPLLNPWVDPLRIRPREALTSGPARCAHAPYLSVSNAHRVRWSARDGIIRKVEPARQVVEHDDRLACNDRFSFLGLGAAYPKLPLRSLPGSPPTCRGAGRNAPAPRRGCRCR